MTNAPSPRLAKTTIAKILANRTLVKKNTFVK